MEKIDVYAEFVANHKDEEVVAWLDAQTKDVFKVVKGNDAATAVGALLIKMAEISDVLSLLNARMNQREKDAPVVVAG